MLDPPAWQGDTEGMSDVFLAVLPDLDAKVRIAGLKDELGLRGSAVAPDRLHVSLHWVGDHETPPAILEAAERAAAAIDMPCFRVAFDRLQTFNGRGQIPIVLAGGEELVGLVMLRELLADRLNHRMKRDFNPHLTFLYGDQATPEITIAPVSWIVRELVLVRSLHGQGRHLVLGRFPLRKGAIG
jgi:2'-5' RNA ligase